MNILSYLFFLVLSTVSKTSKRPLIPALIIIIVIMGVFNGGGLIKDVWEKEGYPLCIVNPGDCKLFKRYIYSLFCLKQNT